MNRIDNLFKIKKSNICSIYFTAGYPKLNDTVTIIEELASAGVDMVEVGVPFSDPMADGPVIQSSGSKALKNGMSLTVLFEQLSGIRERVTIPLVFMTYLNVIMQYGFEEFCKSCKRVGVDGVIIPDLPFADYLDSYKAVAANYGIHMIMLITPETSEERIRLIDKQTNGFIYVVSSAATTGAQRTFSPSAIDYFSRVDAMNLNNPHLIGFGISNKETMVQACKYGNGAIIGSQFISLLAENKPISDSIAELKNRLNI